MSTLDAVLDRIDERMHVSLWPGFAENWFQGSLIEPDFTVANGQVVVVCRMRS